MWNKFKHLETITQNDIRDKLAAYEIQKILRDFGDFPASKSTNHGHNLSVMHEDTNKRLRSIHLARYNLTQDVCCTRCNWLIK